MGLQYRHLDQDTRALMTEEIEADIADGRLFISPRLSAAGQVRYKELLLNAASSGTDDELAQLLGPLMNTHEPPHAGHQKPRKVPHNANQGLAEGEFNRFYIRALCRHALDENIEALIVFRAKTVREPSRESQAKIGKSVCPSTLLSDLRNNPGKDTALGVPRGVNSGLSVTLP